MPFYSYECSKCDGKFRVFHGMDEVQKECTLCHSSEDGILKKVYDKISVSTGNSNKTSSAKDRVNDFIRDSKEQLEQQKQEKSKDYVS